MQIEDKMHRRGRRGMMMPLERRVRLVEGVRMHQAHDRRHRDDTGNQCGKDFPGLGDRDRHHGYPTPVPPLPSPPAFRYETLEKSRPMHKCRHRGLAVSSDSRDGPVQHLDFVRLIAQALGAFRPDGKPLLLCGAEGEDGEAVLDGTFNYPQACPSWSSPQPLSRVDVYS
jgi:hypothetical protein